MVRIEIQELINFYKSGKKWVMRESKYSVTIRTKDLVLVENLKQVMERVEKEFDIDEFTEYEKKDGKIVPVNHLYEFLVSDLSASDADEIKKYVKEYLLNSTEEVK